VAVTDDQADTIFRNVADHVRSLMPTITEMEAIAEDEPGPEVTLRAMYVHLLLAGFEAARLDAFAARTLPTPIANLVARFHASEPGVPLAEEAEGYFVGELAETAVMFAVRPTDAVVVLMSAAAAVAGSKLPEGLAIAALQVAAEETIGRLRCFFAVPRDAAITANVIPFTRPRP
jgi:hypothetical protein